LHWMRSLPRGSGGSFLTKKWQKLPDKTLHFSRDFQKCITIYR
jgi:hypothetical protein